MAAPAEDPRRWSVLWLVAIGELLAMAPWFSASAVARPLNVSWHLDAFGLPGLAIAVQVGFAAGALLLAATAAADRIPARLLFATGATLAAVANLGFAYVAVDAGSALPFRVLTGLALACVYPIGLRLVVGWFRQERGTAIGVVVGALTVGSALPYLIRALGIGQDDWRATVAGASVLALAGGLVVLFAGTAGPWDRPAPRFTIDVVRSAFREPAVRLANIGYLGHMWELYAMWTWVVVFAWTSLTDSGVANVAAAGSMAAFLAIGSGAAGCVLAGYVADRLGKARVAMWAMIASATCAALTVVVYGGAPMLLYLLIMAWGFAVVADSAQFSALVSEHAPRHHVGTALTLQTCVGFLLTMVTIELLPRVADYIGWRWASLVLVPGPLLGAWAMWRLQASDDRMK